MGKLFSHNYIKNTASQKIHDYSISKKAAKDIEHAFDWYEARSIGTLLKLGDEFQFFILKIRTHPYMYRHVGKDVQRSLMKSFPYIIFYNFDGISIIILRVRHKKQRSLKRYK